MSKNYLIIGVIIIVAVILGTIFFEKSRSKESLKADVSAPIEAVKNPSDGVPATQPIQENIVVYTDNGYSPAVLKVKAGTTVTFKNENSAPMWTASDPHPSRTAYPVSGGCISSAFDSCREVAPGDSWQFKFDIIGTWKYHNHLDPGHRGAIIVE